MAENKVQFNLKNVHYALITEGSSEITYGTPVHVPGAVSVSLEPQGDQSPFYADGVVYYNAIANTGYAGDLEMARFPVKMLTEVWGLVEGTTSKVLTENSTAEAKSFALLFQIDGDADSEYYCFYNCSGTRPAVTGTTLTETKEPNTQTSSITCAALADGKIMARTTADTPAATKTNWFKSVFTESASS